VIVQKTTITPWCWKVCPSPLAGQGWGWVVRQRRAPLEISSSPLLDTRLYLEGHTFDMSKPRRSGPRQLAESNAMTQDYLRPCLINAGSCLQAARVLRKPPSWGLWARGGARWRRPTRLLAPPGRPNLWMPVRRGTGAPAFSLRLLG